MTKKMQNNMQNSTRNMQNNMLNMTNNMQNNMQNMQKIFKKICKPVWNMQYTDRSIFCILLMSKASFRFEYP